MKIHKGTAECLLIFYNIFWGLVILALYLIEGGPISDLIVIEITGFFGIIMILCFGINESTDDRKSPFWEFIGNLFLWIVIAYGIYSVIVVF